MHYENLASGYNWAYDFMINQIYTLWKSKLHSWPLCHALASAVVVDVKNEIELPWFPIPDMDNNRLTNDMDTEYYAKLALDQSSPFFNKGHPADTAPGLPLEASFNHCRNGRRA